MRNAIAVMRACALMRVCYYPCARALYMRKHNLGHTRAYRYGHIYDMGKLSQKVLLNT